MNSYLFNKVGLWGCGPPVETSAKGRSTGRGDSRDRCMNNIRNTADEIILNELIYT